MILRFLALVFALLLLLGCDFSEPIAEQPSHDIDLKLLGVWQSTQKTSTYYKVTKEDSTHYSFESRSGQKGTIWHNTVGTTDFLTIKVEDPPIDKPYIYATWAINGDEAHVRYVSNGSEFAADPRSSVIERIKRHVQDEDFFQEPLVFKRAD